MLSPNMLFVRTVIKVMIVLEKGEAIEEVPTSSPSGFFKQSHRDPSLEICL